MIVPVYQILIPLLCLLMIVNNWIRHRSGEFNMRGFVLWSSIWLILGIFAVFPNMSGYIAHITGIKDSFRALTITALIFLFYLAFHNLVRIDRLNRELTRVIREDALREKGSDSKPRISESSKKDKK